MKNSILYVMLAVMPFLACSQKPMQVFTKQDKEIKVKAHESFAIMLPSQPGTGYSWHFKTPIDSTVLVLVKNEHKQPDPNADANAVGRTGFDHFIFTAKQKGSTTIDLWYVRSWLKNDPKDSSIESASYHVTVQ